MPVPLRWDLQLHPPSLEAEFWSHGPVRNYLELADRWCWVMVVCINFGDRSAFPHFTAYPSIDLLRFVPILFMLFACVQRFFLYCSPDAYWKHRTAMTYANIVARIMQQALTQPNGEGLRSQCERQLHSKPAWLLSATLLLATGFMLHAIRRLNFTVSFKGTLLSSCIWLLFCARRYSRETCIALDHASLQQGVTSICGVVHGVMGSLLFLPLQITEAEIERCAFDCLWLACFAQILGAMLPVAGSYIAELYWKCAFLRGKGLIGDEPAWTQTTCVLVVCLHSSYIGAYVMQYVFMPS